LEKEKVKNSATVRSEGDALRRVLVCPPTREYARGGDDLAAHNFEGAPDADIAPEEHAALRRFLTDAGVEVVTVDELPGHPNSVFVRDSALIVPGGFVRLRMGLPARRGEDEWMAAQLRSLGLVEIGAIEGPGTMEGGDVFLLGDVALVGLSTRANPEGAAQLARILEPLGYEVRTARMEPPYFHLGCVISPVGPNRVVAVAGSLPRDFLKGIDVIEAPVKEAVPTANVLCIDDGEVLADLEETPATLDALEGAGVRVHRLQLGEFAKGSGGATCLALPLVRG
jgi:dimethylargininase